MRVNTRSEGDEPYRRVVIEVRKLPREKGRGGKFNKDSKFRREQKAEAPAETAPETVNEVMESDNE